MVPTIAHVEAGNPHRQSTSTTGGAGTAPPLLYPRQVVIAAILAAVLMTAGCDKPPASYYHELETQRITEQRAREERGGNRENADPDRGRGPAAD